MHIDANRFPIFWERKMTKIMNSDRSWRDTPKFLNVPNLAEIVINEKKIGRNTQTCLKLGNIFGLLSLRSL